MKQCGRFLNSGAVAATATTPVSGSCGCGDRSDSVARSSSICRWCAAASCPRRCFFTCFLNFFILRRLRMSSFRRRRSSRRFLVACWRSSFFTRLRSSFSRCSTCFCSCFSRSRSAFSCFLHSFSSRFTRFFSSFAVLRASASCVFASFLSSFKRAFSAFFCALSACSWAFSASLFFEPNKNFILLFVVFASVCCRFANELQRRNEIRERDYGLTDGTRVVAEETGTDPKENKNHTRTDRLTGLEKNERTAGDSFCFFFFFFFSRCCCACATAVVNWRMKVHGNERNGRWRRVEAGGELLQFLNVRLFSFRWRFPNGPLVDLILFLALSLSFALCFDPSIRLVRRKLFDRHEKGSLPFRSSFFTQRDRNACAGRSRRRGRANKTQNIER